MGMSFWICSPVRLYIASFASAAASSSSSVPVFAMIAELRSRIAEIFTEAIAGNLRYASCNLTCDFSASAYALIDAAPNAMMAPAPITWPAR